MTLQPRQRELLELLATGMTIEAAAERMGVTLSHAKQQASRAYARLGTDNKVGAFLALGWLRVPDSQDPERLDGWTRRMLGR